MTVAIMQPYLFPYIGYFQLMQAAGTFVVYDDVNFIRNGWINRNRWLSGGKAAYFTFPIQDASSFRTIAETLVDDRGRWREKMLRSFEQNYRKAPYFAEARSLLEPVVNSQAPSIGARARASLVAVKEYLGLPTQFIESSATFGNAHLSGAERVLDICRQLGATDYVNSIGGVALYSKPEFAACGIELRFIRPKLIPYSQTGADFVEGLSILDAIAYNPVADVRRFLTEYQCE